MPPVRASLWKIANRFGTRRLAAWSQNDQYRRGRWAHLAEGRRPKVTELVEKLADGGRIVEHACGEGHLIRTVDPSAYSSYVGYDISEVAVASARSRATDMMCRFEVQDITTWPGDTGIRLIVAEECLNYLRPGQLATFLERCRASLTPDGAILATFHDIHRYPDTVETCLSRFPDHEVIDDAGGACYLVLRP